MDAHAMVPHTATYRRRELPQNVHPVGRMLIMVGSIMSVLWPCASSPMRICDGKASLLTQLKDGVQT